MMRGFANIGVVAIGRNEGERLRLCIESVVCCVTNVVYVDSGSDDGSIGVAKSLGAEIVNLDMSRPFSAARARNTGLKRLREIYPSCNLVQFVDGDCQLVEAWLEDAASFLTSSPKVAVVCGRLRERYPQRSIYNLLCDLEWDLPIGEAKSCGGIAMVRVKALEEVGGYREDMIAGEEPELCLRLRNSGWKIWRLDSEMALHDADLIRFGQWWQRCKRSGYAYANGYDLHRHGRVRLWRTEVRRTVLWGGILPAAIVVGTMINSALALFVLVYPFQIVRIALRSDNGQKTAWLEAIFPVLGRFAELQGVIYYHVMKKFRKQPRIIEYKIR